MNFREWLLAETDIYDIAATLLPDDGKDLLKWLVMADALDEAGEPELAYYIRSRSGHTDSGEFTTAGYKAEKRYWGHWPFTAEHGHRDGDYVILPFANRQSPWFAMRGGFTCWYADTILGNVWQFEVRERKMRPVRRFPSAVMGLYMPGSNRDRPLASIDLRDADGFGRGGQASWSPAFYLVQNAMLNGGKERLPRVDLRTLPKKLVEYLLHIAIGWKVRTGSYGKPSATADHLSVYGQWSRESDTRPPNPYVRDDDY